MLLDTIKQLNQRKAAIVKEIAVLNAEDKKIDRAIEAITSLPATTEGTVAAPVKTKKRTMSAAARKAIGAAATARWAKINAAKSAPVAAPVQAAKPAKKGKLSAAGRAAISAAAKARWAKINAAKAKAAKKK